MKRILLVVGLTLIIYLSYIVLIMAPLVRVPFVKNSEFITDTIVNPAFQMTFLLPFILIYSAIRHKDYFNMGFTKNTIFHILFYFIISNLSFLFGKNGIDNYMNYSSVILIGMLGAAIYLIFHVWAMRYLLRIKKISRFIGVDKKEI